MVLYQILFRVQPFHERGKSITSMFFYAFLNMLVELLEMIAMSNEEDQLIRPSFPSTHQSKEEGYNLQLLSCLEACWLELPEMRPNIKKVRTMVNANLRST